MNSRAGQSNFLSGSTAPNRSVPRTAQACLHYPVLWGTTLLKFSAGLSLNVNFQPNHRVCLVYLRWVSLAKDHLNP